MIGWLSLGLIGLCGIATIWGLISFIANKPPGKAQLIFAAFVELVTLGQSVVGAVRLIGGLEVKETATSIGYLIGIVLLIPIAWFWANNERTRFAGVVLAVAAFAVLGMTLRLQGLMVAVASSS